MNNASALGTKAITIEGTGTVGGAFALNANYGGSIQPGADGDQSTAPGTLYATTNVVLPSGATSGAGYDVQLASGANSLLYVTGTVNLNNAMLNLSALNGFVPASVGQTFKIIKASGAITGTFANAGTLSTPNATYTVSTQTGGDDYVLLTVHQLTQTPTTESVTTSSTSVTYGNMVSFTAVVTAPLTSNAPTGSVVFWDGTTDLSALPTAVSSSSSSGTTTTWTLTLPYAFKVTAPLGDTITAAYTATGNFASDTATVTQTVTKRAITLTAAAWDKIYDGSTAAPGAVPTVTGGSLAVNPVTGENDTLDYTESFTSRNAISTGFISNPLVINQATGSVSDGDGGNSSANYSVTYLNSTAGAILPLAITVTATAATKPFDGNTSVGSSATPANATPTITAGTVFTPANPDGPTWPPMRPPTAAYDTLAFTETYASAAAGSEALVPAGSVNDGNGGFNYSVTFDNASGTITRTATHFVVTTQTSPLSVTAGSNFLLELEAENANGNLVPGYTGTVSFTSSDSTEAAWLSQYTMTFEPGTGVAFALVSLQHVGTWSITATATSSNQATNPTGTSNVVTDGITVTNGSPTQVAISTIANTYAGTTIPVSARWKTCMETRSSAMNTRRRTRPTR